MIAEKPYKTGLVLSGGAARGFAHIGILKAMHEWGYIPDAVSGVSAGSIVGAFYCDGYAPEEIFEIFSQRKLFDFFRLSLPKYGFLEMTGLRDVLKKNLRKKNVSGLEKAPMDYCNELLHRKNRIFKQRKYYRCSNSIE